MKSIKRCFFAILVGLLFVYQACYALPFSITPLGTLPTTVDNVSNASAYYTVKNITTVDSPASFVKFLPPFVKQVVDKAQPTFCGAVFNLAPNASCILALSVTGPVNARDPNPEHHLFVCRQGGKTCAGTPDELNVRQITLVSIAVTPALATIPKGTTQQYAATGTFSDGSTKSLINYPVVWASGTPAVATINATTGLATAASIGAASITASLGGVTSPAATLNVSAAVLTSISITPLTPSIPKGTTLQYTAIGTYSDGTTADITALLLWTSTDTTKATIAAGGLATGVAVGSTNITATSGAVTSNTSVLSVTAAVLECITVTPDPGNVGIDGTLQFTATGSYSDGSTSNLTGSATWVSSDSSVASIGITGLAEGEAAGTTNITATQGGITSQPVVLTVSAALLSIDVTPNPFVIYLGESYQYTATGNFSTGPSVPVTNSVTWGSGNSALASVSGTGLVTGVSPGTTNIIATMNDVIGTASVMVNNQVLYAGMLNTNICTSSNGGTTWGSCMAQPGPVTGMASAAGRIYAVIFPSSFCFTPNTSVWTCPVGATPTSSAIAALDLNFVYFGTDSSDQIVNVSSNGGVTFSSGVIVFPGFSNILTSLAVTDLTHLYAGMQLGQVCKSIDNGSSWPGAPCVATGLLNLNSLAVNRTNGNLYAGGSVTLSGSVCVSTNAGVSFTCTSTPLTGNVISLAVNQTNGNVYAGTDANRVCVSSNSASTFTCVELPISSTTVTSLTVDRYGSVFAGTGSGMVCRSFDNGATWPLNLCNTVAASQINGLVLTQP